MPPSCHLFSRGLGPHATHPNPMGPVDPVPEPQPGNPLPPEPVGPHPTPAPV